MLNSCRHLHILEAYCEGVLLSWAETTRGLLLTWAKSNGDYFCPVTPGRELIGCSDLAIFLVVSGVSQYVLCRRLKQTYRLPNTTNQSLLVRLG